MKAAGKRAISSRPVRKAFNGSSIPQSDTPHFSSSHYKSTVKLFVATKQWPEKPDMSHCFLCCHKAHQFYTPHVTVEGLISHVLVSETAGEREDLLLALARTVLLTKANKAKK